MWFDINYVWKVLNVLRTSCDTGLQMARKTFKELSVLEAILMGEVIFNINNPPWECGAGQKRTLGKLSLG